jgi:hypothetical protein
MHFGLEWFENDIFGQKKKLAMISPFKVVCDVLFAWFFFYRE